MGVDRKFTVGIIDFLREKFNIQPGTWLQNKLERTPLYNFFLNIIFRHQSPPYTVADKLTDRVIDDMENECQKSFYFVHYWDTHIPYWPPDKYIRKDKFFGGYTEISDLRKNISAPLRRFFFDKMMARYKTAGDVMNAYDGEIRFIDDNIGRLLNTIDLEESLVIITADHGEVMMENPTSYFTHDSFDKCVMNIPMLLYYPGCKPGRENREVSLCDIAPTIVRAVGGEIQCDGESLI